eukprot:Rhum_TRINITY_DN14152_c2_g1::Rhum_TRINITY_DN14152_c2_g1_i1::g.70293::m.70293
MSFCRTNESSAVLFQRGEVPLASPTTTTTTTACCDGERHLFRVTAVVVVWLPHACWVCNAGLPPEDRGIRVAVAVRKESAGQQHLKYRGVVAVDLLQVPEPPKVKGRSPDPRHLPRVARSKPVSVKLDNGLVRQRQVPVPQQEQRHHHRQRPTEQDSRRQFRLARVEVQLRCRRTQQTHHVQTDCHGDLPRRQRHVHQHVAEELLVVVAHTRVDPRAVVVHLQHAAVAEVAVVAARRLPTPARLAEAGPELPGLPLQVVAFRVDGGQQSVNGHARRHGHCLVVREHRVEREPHARAELRNA